MKIDELNKIMFALVKRLKPEIKERLERDKSWYDYSPFRDVIICRLCDADIGDIYVAQSIEEHILSHLKEHNLLALI